MRYAALLIAVTLIISMTIVMAVTYSWRRASRIGRTDVEARNPLSDRAQQQLLSSESSLVNDLLAKKIAPEDYRRSMAELAEAARNWPNPAVPA